MEFPSTKNGVSDPNVLFTTKITFYIVRFNCLITN